MNNLPNEIILEIFTWIEDKDWITLFIINKKLNLVGYLITRSKIKISIKNISKTSLIFIYMKKKFLLQL